MSPTSLKIPDDVKERYQVLAKQTRRSTHWLMIDALKEYIDKKESRMNYIREGLEALEEYRKTGLHLTQEEVFDWLSTWGTEEEKELPECHK